MLYYFRMYVLLRILFKSQPFYITLLLLAALGGAGYWHLSQIESRNQAVLTYLNEEITNLSQSLASSTALINGELTVINEALSLTQSENSKLLDELAQEQQRVSSFQKEIKKVSSTVGDLEKLSKTDPELLQKYSKVFFLNEHYAPPRLATIDKKYLYSENQVHKLHEAVLPYLKEMLDDALKDGVELYVKSAFRSFNEQSVIKGAFTVTYGEGTANQFSADQGYSEHQLGTTVDLISPGLGGQLTVEFANSPGYKWLLENAHTYGFTLSYPPDNTYYMYEPWHWRFVGVDLATQLHKKGQYFYDWDQRDIDEYLIQIFD